MYTQCPHCQTCFRIAEAHLKAAKGKVRCGSCKQVFDATSHLYSNLPDGEPVTPPAAEPTPPPVPQETMQTTRHSAPLPGIGAAFAEDEHEHIDLSSPPAEPPAPLSIPQRDEMPDQSPFMESLVGEYSRYNNLDSMGSIDIPGEAPMTDSFIRFVDTDNPPGADETAADTTAEQFDLSRNSETDEAIASIKAQLSEFDFDEEPRTPYEDTEQPDLPANTAERNAIGDMYLDAMDQLSSQSEENDPEKLNADIDALLDEAMALDNDKRTGAALEIEVASGSDLINDQLVDESETLARFEAELQDMKLEPSLDDNASIFDVDYSEQFLESDDSDFAQFDLQQPEPKTKDKPAKADRPRPEPAKKKNPFLEDEPASTLTRKDSDSAVVVASDKFDDDFLGDIEPASAARQEQPVPIQQVDDEVDSELPSLEHDIPKALRSSFEHFEPKKRPLWLNLSMGFGSFALILILLGQVVLFRSYQLANQFPAFTPMLSKLCKTLSCRYSGDIDVSQIQLLNRNISSHPSQKNALLISTAFVNQAKFDQPYPVIAIRLSDLSGEVVATRYFRPREYLDNLYNPFLLMESGTPVHVTLAVLDPGNDAVNYEFDFL